jgi:hypothetical protein
MLVAVVSRNPPPAGKGLSGEAEEPAVKGGISPARPRTGG